MRTYIKSLVFHIYLFIYLIFVFLGINRLVDGEVWSKLGPGAEERDPRQPLSTSYASQHGVYHLLCALVDG